MTAIDTPTLVNWIVQGAISLVFGLIGGYLGSWFQYRFTRQLERDRDRKALRERLTDGVSHFMEVQRRAELGAASALAFLKRLSLNLIALAAAVLAFAWAPWAGLAILFAWGLSLGWQRAGV
jgi:hypothetical protein